MGSLRELFRRPLHFRTEDFYNAGHDWALTAPVVSPEGIPFDAVGVRQVGLETMGETLLERAKSGENIKVPSPDHAAEAYCKGFRDGLERRASTTQ